MNKIPLALLACSLLTINTANADVGLGVGVTYIFGNDINNGIAIGPKLFTTNEEKKVAASAGIDYVVKTSSFRPNIGISYLFKDDVYADINVGYNLMSKKPDIGVGIGYTKTDTPNNNGNTFTGDFCTDYPADYTCQPELPPV